MQLSDPLVRSWSISGPAIVLGLLCAAVLYIYRSQIFEILDRVNYSQAKLLYRVPSVSNKSNFDRPYGGLLNQTTINIDLYHWFNFSGLG